MIDSIGDQNAQNHIWYFLPRYDRDDQDGDYYNNLRGKVNVGKGQWTDDNTNPIEHFLSQEWSERSMVAMLSLLVSFPVAVTWYQTLCGRGWGTGATPAAGPATSGTTWVGGWRWEGGCFQINDRNTYKGWENRRFWLNFDHPWLGPEGHWHLPLPGYKVLWVQLQLQICLREEGDHLHGDRLHPQGQELHGVKEWVFWVFLI